MVRPARRLRPGTRVTVTAGAQSGSQEAEVLEVFVLNEPPLPDGQRVVRLVPDRGSVAEALERLGHVPLPPYIRRPDEPADRERYQTVFAREKGSVAAPTAGLHFTEALLSRLGERGIETAEIVLHVGPGTFRPVQVADVREHEVPPEPFRLPDETAAAIARARARGSRIVAVGTTTTRVLETRADESGQVAPGAGETALVIVPPHRFRAVDALVTNFHLPRSSLLLLVAAFVGRERVLAAYDEALRAGYRFYSYGDAMLVV
jgi:S-adenosylmethionine:tRNA ribosyltransferase-isomerase